MQAKRLTGGIVLFLLAFSIFVTPLFSQTRTIVFDDIKIIDDDLTTSFHIDSLLSPKAIEGLQKGLTVSIEYDLELWKKRPGWFDQSVKLLSNWIKVAYFRLEKRYIISTPDERRRTNSITKMYNSISTKKDIPVLGVDDLEAGNQYYFTLDIRIKPLSSEDISDISRWLEGNEENKKEADKQLPKKNILNKLMNVVVNFTGLREKQVKTQSRIFLYDKNKSIQFQELR